MYTADITNYNDTDVTAMKQEIIYVDYDSLLRYPQKNEGKAMQWEGNVIQVMNGDIRLGVSKEGIESNVIYVSLKTDQAKSVSVLEGDIVRVTGLTAGNHKYKAVLGNSVTLPKLDAYELQIIRQR